MAAPERLASALKAFWQARGGNIATLAALTLPLALMAAAFAVDEAALYFERRRLQAAVDLAAIAAAADPANAEAHAVAVLRESGLVEPGAAVDTLVDVDIGRLDVTLGQYVADPDLAVGQRFLANATPANAAAVSFAHRGRLYFARSWFGEPTIAASAVAHSSAQAAFSLGSRLASLDGGIANAVLEGLLGTSISLRAMDHRALLDLDVDLLEGLDALATRLDLTALTYDDILATEIALPDLAAALATAAGAGDPGATVLAALAPTLDDGLAVTLSDVIALGPVGRQPIAGRAEPTLMVSAFDLLTTAALLSGGGSQIALDLGATLPGLGGATLSLSVGEPMQHTGYVAVGARAATLETAQLRLALTVSVRVPSGTSLGLLDVRLPIVLALAPARAELASVTCPPAGRVTLAVTPGLLSLAIGHPADLARTSGALTTGPAPIVDVLGLVRVTAHASAAAHQIAPVSVGFGAAEIAAGTVRTVATTTPLQSLLTTLLADLDLEVDVAGLPILRPILALGVEDALQTTLVGLAPALDTLLVGVLSSLGIAVGEADARVNGLACSGAVLVG